MQKVAKTSDDIENENLQKLQGVFPQFVKDGAIDFDALKAFFDKEGTLAGTEKYGLNWAGKSSAFKAIRTGSTGTLTPDEKESKNFETTENIFIEGDNLEVLKLLQKHYREQIKMIYIDPPYNTGKDFIYTDNFTENKNDYYERTGQSCDGIKLTSNPESNGRYHSDWLTMMYPRLFLARNLLREDGVIFVSIDDHEVANLRMIMDEIFGEENFISSFVWHNNVKGRQMDLYVKNTYETTLMYSKNFEKLNVATQKDVVDVSNLDRDEISYYKKDYPLHNGTADFHINNRPNLGYSIYYNPATLDAKTIDEKIKEKDVFIIGSPSEEGVSLIQKGYFRIIPKYNNTYNNQRVWRWGAPKFLLEYNTELLFEKESGGYYVYQKKRFEDGVHEKTFKNYINIDSGTGKKELNELLGGKLFDSPKPVSLLKTLLQIGLEDNQIVLDFFAGSGTTAHAVMDLNAEDGGNRKWICVQIPEGTNEDSEACKAGYLNIAQISRERIRRAGDKIAKGDTGFKAFALSKSNYSEWNTLTDKDDEATLKKQSKLFIEQPLVAGFDEKSVVYEILLKEGFDLNSKVEKFKKEKEDFNFWEVSEGGKKLYISFDKQITQEKLKWITDSSRCTFVCFDSALDDTTKVNLMRNLTVKTI